MKILFLGDVVGVAGCSKLTNNLLNEIKLKNPKFEDEGRTFGNIELGILKYFKIFSSQTKLTISNNIVLEALVKSVT